MSSATSSSRSHTGRQTNGIPTRCWCGAKLTTFGAQTKENLFRRFYRCEIGLQRKNEQHLFKWVDEAIVDEVNMVDAKHTQLKEDVDSFKMLTAKRFDKQAQQIEQTMQQISKMMEANTNTRPSSSYNTLTNIAVAGIAIGTMATMAWFYSRINN